MRKRQALGLHRHPSALREKTPSVSEPAPKKVRWSRKTVQRRATRLRKYFVVLMVLIIGGVAGVEIYQYRTARMWGSELFLLEEIVVAGNKRISTDEVLRALPLTLYTTTMQEVVPRRLEALLRDQFVDFKEVEVVREMPGRVWVRVVERQPLARVRVDGKVVVIDEEGVVLERPFKEKQNERIATLPVVTTNIVEGETRGVPLQGNGLREALRLLALNREHSLAKSKPVSLAHPVREVPSNETPSSKVPLRVLRPDELKDQPLDIESVDARDPRRIVVRFRPTYHREVTAWFSEDYLAEGLNNFYRAYTYRLLTVPMAYDVSVVPSAFAASSGIQESSPVFSAGTVAAAAAGIPSFFLQERYDARFESTLYITSTGGHHG